MVKLTKLPDNYTVLYDVELDECVEKMYFPHGVSLCVDDDNGEEFMLDNATDEIVEELPDERTTRMDFDVLVANDSARQEYQDYRDYLSRLV